MKKQRNLLVSLLPLLVAGILITPRIANSKDLSRLEKQAKIMSNLLGNPNAESGFATDFRTPGLKRKLVDYRSRGFPVEDVSCECVYKDGGPIKKQADLERPNVSNPDGMLNPEHDSFNIFCSPTGRVHEGVFKNLRGNVGIIYDTNLDATPDSISSLYLGDRTRNGIESWYNRVIDKAYEFLEIGELIPGTKKIIDASKKIRGL